MKIILSVWAILTNFCNTRQDNFQKGLFVSKIVIKIAEFILFWILTEKNLDDCLPSLVVLVGLYSEKFAYGIDCAALI